MDIEYMKSTLYMTLVPEGYKLETGKKPDYSDVIARITSIRGSWAAFSAVCESTLDAILLNARRTAFTQLGAWPVYRVDRKGLPARRDRGARLGLCAPEPDKTKFHLNLWQHVANIARKHEVALFSNAHFTVLDEYATPCALY